MFDQLGAMTYVALWSTWSIIFLLVILGPETISEITLWKASIKRDVEAAGEIRKEVEKTSSDLKRVVKLVAENAYIQGSMSLLAGIPRDSDHKGRERLESNLEELADFAEGDKVKQDEWWGDLEKVFAGRHGERDGG